MLALESEGRTRTREPRQRKTQVHAASAGLCLDGVVCPVSKSAKLSEAVIALLTTLRANRDKVDPFTQQRIPLGPLV